MVDLAGVWDGRFAYPVLYEPEPFVARIHQAGDWVTGSIEENDNSSGKRRPSTIMGKCFGRAVVFSKSYDQPDDEYDVVSYEGNISEDQEEVSGIWTIRANWSGTFLMVCRRAEGLRAETAHYQVV